MIMLGEILPYCKPGSKDFRRLGRWDSSILTAKQTTILELSMPIVFSLAPESSCGVCCPAAYTLPIGRYLTKRPFSVAWRTFDSNDGCQHPRSHR